MVYFDLEASTRYWVLAMCIALCKREQRYAPGRTNHHELAEHSGCGIRSDIRTLGQLRSTAPVEDTDEDCSQPLSIPHALQEEWPGPHGLRHLEQDLELRLWVQTWIVPVPVEVCFSHTCTAFGQDENRAMTFTGHLRTTGEARPWASPHACVDRT